MLKKIKLKQDYQLLTKEDKEPAQEQDFNLWCELLKDRIQELYDEIFVNRKAAFENKAKLDFIYTNIEEICRQGEELLKKN